MKPLCSISLGPLALLLLLFLAGCAAKSEPSGESMEWRVKSLEESFLQFQETQRGTQDRVAALEARMEERFKRLEAELEEAKLQLAQAPATLEPVTPPPVARSAEPRSWTAPPTKAQIPPPAKAQRPPRRPRSRSPRRPTSAA